VSWWDKAKEVFDIEEEKVERMAQTQVSEGGRITLPEPGEELLVYITREPVEVESEKLKEMGIEKALFARCRKVEVVNGKVEVGMVEYDLPMSKTMVMSAAASMKREGEDPNDIVGRVFLITARYWKDAPAEYKRGKEKVKTYVMTYKPDLTSKVNKEEVAQDFAEDIEL